MKISVQIPITLPLSPLGREGKGNRTEKRENMVVSAYVLIRVEADKNKSAFEALTKLREVRRAHTVTGPFEIILLLEAKDLHELREVILNKIRGKGGVSRATTCVTGKLGPARYPCPIVRVTEIHAWTKRWGIFPISRGWEFNQYGSSAQITAR